MDNKYNIRIRELQDIGLNEYLSLEINKCFYDFCYEYLKVERDLPSLDVFDMLKNSYSNALIFTDNYTTAPYELNDYFVNKFNKLEGLESEQLFIKTIEYHFFMYLIMYFNENIIVDKKCNYCIGDNQVLDAIYGKVFKFHWIVIGLTHEVLEKKYRPQDKRKSKSEKENNMKIKPRYKGWFSDEVVDSMYAYVENAFPSFQVKPIMRFKESVKDKIFPKEKEVTTVKHNPLEWSGTPTEFIELVKALIVSKVLKGTQKDIINNLSGVFGLKINHPDKLIQDIINRNTGSETLFLDKLKENLYEYTQK